MLTELIALLETARAAQAVTESNIQGLTAELAAVRTALADVEDRRAKIEGLYEQVLLGLFSVVLMVGGL